MLIKCWGARGSIPVSGKNFDKYGGDTTCMEINYGGKGIIVIDAGTGIRLLGNKLVASGEKPLIHLLLTHAHWDHLSGFPFFKPIYIKGNIITVYGPQPTQRSLKKIISKTMEAPYFPVEFEDVNADISFVSTGNHGYSIESVKIKTIPISHPNRGVGYRLEENGRSFVFLTDNELTYRHKFGRRFDDYLKFAEGADIFIHDAEYTREEYAVTKRWGHSVYLDALDLALKAGVKSFGLFHHNQDRTDTAVDGMVRSCKKIISERGSKMKCFAVRAGQEMKV